MKRRHRMPFGAEVLDDGGVRFRIWAPAASGVQLCLESSGASGGAELGMHALGNGWFELGTSLAGVGTHYRYRADRGIEVPDPASRFNPEDVHGPSEVVDPRAFDWQDADWRGRAWEEVVLYELHVGAFTGQGTFAGVVERLDYLRALGVTAVELMPVADFSGQRNWGYDGVLLFAPDSRYGCPDDLKNLVQAAHARGLMVFLDVVYNHFGPDGNYLNVYAPQFFSASHHTPWGACINFDGPESRVVRDFFIHNALYWIEEFHLDGLRLDAVNAIRDDSTPHLLEEIAVAVRSGPGATRPIHLVLENLDNAPGLLVRDERGWPRHYTAQWSDDLHDSLHVLLTGEEDGRYVDFADDPLRHLGRCLTEGCAFQGAPSPFWQIPSRGEPTGHLPATAWVGYLQTHDQPGNRGFGERISHLVEPKALRVALALVLLAPSPPLLFMGEEFAACEPFVFFCDFGPELAAAVRRGRQLGFARLDRFADPAARERVPDPNALETFLMCKLDWSATGRSPHAEWLALYRRLLALRQQHVVPRLAGIGSRGAEWRQPGARSLGVTWLLGDGSRLEVLANVGDDPVASVTRPEGEAIYLSEGWSLPPVLAAPLPPWSIGWFLQRSER